MSRNPKSKLYSRDVLIGENSDDEDFFDDEEDDLLPIASPKSDAASDDEKTDDMETRPTMKKKSVFVFCQLVSTSEPVLVFF